MMEGAASAALLRVSTGGDESVLLLAWLSVRAEQSAPACAECGETTEGVPVAHIALYYLL